MVFASKHDRYNNTKSGISLIVKLIGLLGCGSLLIGSVQAAPVTQNFISAHDQPLYAGVTHMPYANPDAPKGGMLSLSANGTFDNFQTLNGKGSDADGVSNLYDTLMKRSLSEAAVNYPLLATSVTLDPNDHSYVIFHLNPKAQFSNGTPLRADDVVFSFNALLDKGAPGLRVYLSDVKKVTALNPLDVRFDFKSKDNAEIASIVSEVTIYSKKDFASKAYDRIMATAPLGSGPYTLYKVDAGRSITYKRNTNYWGRDLPVNRGRNNVDLIKYVYYRNTDIAFEGFKSGQFFVHDEKKARTWALSYNFPAVTQGIVRKQAFATQNPVPTQMFVLNNRRAPLDDIYLRQALTYAYDFEWQNKALFFKSYQRLQSFFHGSELAATGKPTPDELKILTPLLNRLSPLQQQGVLADWRYPSSDASGYNRQNLIRARQILLKAGYRYQHGKLLDKTGKPIVLEFMISQDGLQRTILPFVHNAERLGIQIDLRLVDVPQAIERMRRFDYDIVTSVIPQSNSPGNEQMQFWSSMAADEQGNYNFAGIKSPVIDQVISGLIQAPDRQVLQTYTHVLDRLLRAGYYVIPTYGKVGSWIATWDMYEQPKTLPKYDIGMDYWWVNPKKAARVNAYLSRQQDNKD